MNRYASIAIAGLSLLWSGNVFADPCIPSWAGTVLDTGVLSQKGSYAETNTAYASVPLDSTGSTVYRIQGGFPHARYMSLEVSRFEREGGWDFSSIQDHEINPDPGSYNPFTPGVDLNAEPRNFTIDAVPEGAEWSTVNRLELPADGSNSALLLRIVAPNDGVVIRPEDLPTIEAFDAHTGAPKECPKLADSGSGNPWAGGRFYAKVKEIFLLIGRKRTKKSWHWTRFDVVDIPFEGNSGVSGYSVGRTQIAPGRNVAITKFKAPTFVNTFPGTGTFEPDAEMRYWSMCVLDLEEAQTLACLPDYLAKVDPEGFVTVVYARPGPGVEMIANSYGYNFLPDLREPTFENGRKMMMFVYRQILPSEEFAMTKLHQGDYVPQRKVCPRFFFLAGVCGI